MALSKESFIRRLKSVDTLEELSSLREEAVGTENVYRELFARQRDSWEIPEIDDPLIFLINVYENAPLFRKLSDFADTQPRCCPLEDALRYEVGSTVIVPNYKEFHVSWDCFTEGLLRFVDWNNVLAAGGSVAGCLAPLPDNIQTANAATTRVLRRRYFHDTFLPGSDIDLFLYGLEPSQAEAKLLEIFDAVQAASPYEVRAFRSAHAITLVSRYPFRHVQIVLRLYNSPSEVLMGFDVDSCAAGKILQCPHVNGVPNGMLLSLHHQDSMGPMFSCVHARHLQW